MVFSSMAPVYAEETDALALTVSQPENSSTDTEIIIAEKRIRFLFMATPFYIEGVCGMV